MYIRIYKFTYMYMYIYIYLVTRIYCTYYLHMYIYSSVSMTVPHQLVMDGGGWCTLGKDEQSQDLTKNEGKSDVVP